MVSFSCENCGDVLTKKKLDGHRGQCRGASFTCIDCMVHFEGTAYRAHTVRLSNTLSAPQLLGFLACSPPIAVCGRVAVNLFLLLWVAGHNLADNASLRRVASPKRKSTKASFT